MSLPFGRLSFLAIGFLLGTVAASAPAFAAPPLWVYIGTNNSKLSKGIYKSEFDIDTGKFSEPVLVAPVANPSFLAIHPNKKFLYAVSEISSFGGKKAGGVAAFAIDPKTGGLTALNEESSGGDGPCHLIVDKAGKNVIVANYGGGSCAVLPIDADGKLKPASDFHQFEGKVFLPKRQGSPHAHCATVSPDGKFAFVTDLGLDRINIFKLDSDKGKLIPNDPPFFSTAPGAGPRHFTFHPSGKTALVVNEIDMTVQVLDYDAAKGTLTSKQVLSTLAKGTTQTPDYKYSTAEVVVSPNGNNVYVSNRTRDTIAQFSYSQFKPEAPLYFLGEYDAGKQIKIPRNFNVDPSGKWILIANQDGGTILVSEILQPKGLLSNVKNTVKIGSPCCIKFYSPLAQ